MSTAILQSRLRQLIFWQLLPLLRISGFQLLSCLQNRTCAMPKDTKTYNILVVEDNLGDFVIVEDLLMEQMYSPVISHAVNFKHASEILSKSVFDIVLLDLTLPDKNNRDLIAEMLKIACQSPIIILTGFSDIDF